MQRLINVLSKMERQVRISKRLLWSSYFLVLCAIVLFFTSCEQNWPELTPTTPIIPEVPVDECIISLYHAITTDGKSQDTLGINIAYVEKAFSPGKWFMSGDYNAWPTPVNAPAITKTTIINGKTYLIWGSIGQIGLEKCNGGKYLADGSSSWFFAPKSVYWHVNPAGGGEFWFYRKTAGVSNNP